MTREPERVGAVARHAHHEEIGLRREQRLETVADDGVMVGNQDPDAGANGVRRLGEIGLERLRLSGFGPGRFLIFRAAVKPYIVKSR